MGKRSSTDQAIRNIMNWATRSEWSHEQSAVFDEHFARVCDHIGVSPEELNEEFEELGLEGMLFGVMFEDFVSRRLAPDDRNIIDDYLKRRGWRESVPGRRYLQQLRDSVLSMYEVVEVSPGHHCDVRDLVRGGDTFRVYERTGTQTLAKWTQLAARVLTINGKHVFSGGILPFHREAAQSVLKVLTESQKTFQAGLSQIAGEDLAANMPSSEDLDNLFLKDACPGFTSIWIAHTLKQLNEPLPDMVNRDGEALVFTETRFPFHAEQLEDVARRVDAAADWERDNPDEYTWIWIPEPDAGASKNQGGSTDDSMWGEQQPLHGTLEAKPGMLKLTTNSVERSQRGQTALEELLQGLIGPALSSLQTPEQLMADFKSQQQHAGTRESVLPFAPEIEAEIIRQTLDEHYLQSLDEPIPVLGNKTPRQCAKSKKGRGKVIEWLKDLENSEHRRAASQGREPYDSNWMWDELDLERHPDR